MRTPPEGLGVGDTLSQAEIEAAFNTAFGYRISGINPRRDDDDQRYILLFANEDGPYSDSVTQGRFEYIGEGLSGDQSEDSAGNSALIDANTSDIPIHFFYKSADGEMWEYQGLVDVIDYELRTQDGREVLVFTLTHQQQPESASLTAEEIAVEQTAIQRYTSSDPALTTTETQYTERQRRVRDAAFTAVVREAYNETCAICGSKRESPAGTPEVEASHIYPKRKDGSDDPRNGIALCKLHHWAFDTGWLSISDDYTILVKDAPERNGYDEFERLAGNSIQLPDDEDKNPHPKFLGEHRSIHGFDDD
jgi:putative restriction endonuclease